MWLADDWKDYEVIDCSQGEKLERWGRYLLVRPDPQVIWDTPKGHKGWKHMNGHYHRSSKGGGEWEFFDLPDELKKLIESKKDKVMRLTYTTKDYTYVVAGYGTRETSGYSIKVNNVYTGDNALYIDLNLIGPAAGEAVNEVETYPVIVLKMERREESVVFKM